MIEAYHLSISDIVLAVGVPIAIVGIFLTWKQLRQGYEIQKVTFFKELYMTLFSDKDVSEALYLIDKNQLDWKDFWNRDERRVDRLLSYFDMICGLYYAGMLTKQEMVFFKYLFTRVYRNDCIQKYFQHIKKASKDFEIGTILFPSFIKYCEEHFTLFDRK